jgi:flagellar biosynthetic protein FlhB
MSKSDKTEKPTAKKRRDARNKGQVAKSQDLTSWTGLLVGLYLLPMTIGRLAEAAGGNLLGLRSAAVDPQPDLAVSALGHSLRAGFVAIAPLMFAVMLTGVAVSMSQTGLVLSWKAVVPDPKRISPKQGLQRLFSARSVWETVKQVIKITVVVAIAWPRVMGIVEDLAGHGRLALGDALPVAGAGILGLARTITWTVVVLSLADYGYQRYQHARDLRMTKQEVRDEFRNAEGDGMVKGRIRSMQRALARNRMLADIADADVIITNPTHIAVALKYDPAGGRAPIVLATGANDLAARIRERGREADVPLVEAKPLARALWRACDPGDEIPTVLYEAVAQVLAFIRRLDRRMVATSTLELPPHIRTPAEQLDAVPRKRRRR